MKKFDKEDLTVIASWLAFNLSFACVGIATMAEKAGDTSAFAFGIVGFVLLFSASLFGFIFPQLREKK